MMAVVNRGRRLTLETKLRVLDMQKKNFSLQKIRDLLARENISVTRQGIHSFLRTWAVSGTLGRRRRSDRGERKKIRTIHMKFMDMWLAEDNELTTADLCKKLHSVFGIEVSASLVGEVRRKMGWKTCGARYCQLISHKNKKVRMQWCLNALNTNEDFRDVVFVDESSVEMSSNGRLFFHQDASKIQMKCLRRPKPKHAYKVHVWAGISYRGRTGICIFSGIMDSVIYQKILEDNLLPFVEKKFPDGFRLYQDNDSKHNSKSTKAWMEKRGIKDCVMTTPASSPDLNPIENVWASMKHFLQVNVKPKTKDQLVEGIKTFWSSLTAEQCGKYIDHVHRVIPYIVLNDGEPSGF